MSKEAQIHDLQDLQDFRMKSPDIRSVEYQHENQNLSIWI